MPPPHELDQKQEPEGIGERSHKGETKKGIFSPLDNFAKLELDFVQDTCLVVVNCCLSLLMEEEQGLEQKP